jgi:hypothetical protein
VVALGLRLVMARIFFLDGQTKIAGPALPFDLHGFHFSMLLPTQVKAENFTAFMAQFAPLPVPPVPAAYMVSYAEFFLPLMLVLGFGTRVAALGLLIDGGNPDLHHAGASMDHSNLLVRNPYDSVVARRRANFGRSRHSHSEPSRIEARMRTLRKAPLAVFVGEFAVAVAVLER